MAYTGIKGAYISITFSTLVVERNLIYLCPILFAATALALARGVGRGWALAGAALFTLYVVAEVPLRLEAYPYYEAHGLSFAAVPEPGVGLAGGTDRERAARRLPAFRSACSSRLRYLRRGSTAFVAVAATATVVVFAWSLTTEVYAAEGERKHSRQLESGLVVPKDWIDRLTGGGSVVVLGQNMRDDPNDVYLTEFFNESIEKMWSTDGTAPGPGAILTPDLANADGTLTPNPETEYALTLNGVELQAPEVARVGRFILYDVDRQPLKIASGSPACTPTAGWATTAAYNRFDVSGDGPGFVSVNVSREAFCAGAPYGEGDGQGRPDRDRPGQASPRSTRSRARARRRSRTARRRGSGWERRGSRGARR